jgi:hypothetical protein
VSAALAGSLTGSIAGSLLSPRTAGANVTGWAHSNCWFGDQYQAVSPKTRDVMAFGMYYMRWEGYHWGGGCANDNNVDDQPGDPVMDSTTHDEGTAAGSLSEADGSGIWNRTYRSSSSYKGVLRLGWA